MISQICGRISKRKDYSVIIDTNGGILYEVLIPGCVMKALDRNVNSDGTIRLVTYHYHHVDPSRSIPVLIGFLNDIEKEFFEKFITVSGIGPKAAVKALNMPIPQIVKAISEGDLNILKSLPGIGEQRAKEIVAKLQNKIGKFGLIQEEAWDAGGRPAPDLEEEAMEVLLQLQYKRAEAKEMIHKALERASNIKSAEELLNEVYRQKSSLK